MKRSRYSNSQIINNFEDVSVRSWPFSAPEVVNLRVRYRENTCLTC
jgi:hypothetical protein